MPLSTQEEGRFGEERCVDHYDAMLCLEIPQVH